MDSILETTDLTKDFHARRAVDGLSLQVNYGDIYGFLGPNGAGKSTTIRMLTGLVRPTHGSARLLGLDMRAQRVSAFRKVRALVESPAFYTYLSARKNLEILSRLSGECDDKRIDQVLDTVGLLDRAGDKVKTFSHGMVQRLGIAQALLPKPQLIILDEPTNGLDPQGMRDVRELILRLSRDENVTVFLSSHLLHEVEQVCTRVAVINHGKLVAEGAVDQLLRSDTGLVELKVGAITAAIGALRQLSRVEIVSAGEPHAENGGGIEVRCPAEEVPEMTRALVSAGVDVYAIAPKVSTLEDLFMELVEKGGVEKL